MFVAWTYLWRACETNEVEAWPGLALARVLGASRREHVLRWTSPGGASGFKIWALTSRPGLEGYPAELTKWGPWWCDWHDGGKEGLSRCDCRGDAFEIGPVCPAENLGVGVICFKGSKGHRLAG